MTNESSRGCSSTATSLGSPLMTLKNELLLGAVVRGELPTVRRLLDRHGADINSRNSSGLNCLQLAILNRHTKLAEFLIQRGVDIHMVDASGWTPLHDAALMENNILVRKLIAKGLSPMLTTHQGELVIDVAGGTQMERTICEEMCICGELPLARQYYLYLGLGGNPTGNTEETSSSNHHHHHHHHHPRSPITARSAQKQHLIGSKAALYPRLSSPKSAKCKTFLTGSTCKLTPNSKETSPVRFHPDGGGGAAVVANSAEMEQQQVESDKSKSVGWLPNYGHDKAGNHKNVLCGNLSELPVYKDPLLEQRAEYLLDITSPSATVDSATTLASEKVQETEHCEQPVSTSSYCLTSSQVNTAGDSELTQDRSISTEQTPTACESTQGNSREATAIKSLYQHSSFQLQIGLSLLQSQSNSRQFSNLDDITEEDCVDLDHHDSTIGSSDKRSSGLLNTRSPSLQSRRRNLASFDRNIDTTTPQQTTNSTSTTKRLRFPRPLNKAVSFADLPMTRSKAMFVGQTDSKTTTNSSTTSDGIEQKLTRHNSDSKVLCSPKSQSHSLPTVGLIVSQAYQDQQANEDELGLQEGDFEAGIRALQMKPRKSSIASPKRRRSSDGTMMRRRSVSFQPEVLLQEVITDGDIKAVSEILESGIIQDVNKMTPSGLTALHQSAVDGNLDCAKALVAKGADVNCTDCEHWTPLHAAALTGSLEFVRFLLTSGARPHLMNNEGETPYDVAKHRPIRKMLLHAMNGKNLDSDEFSDGEYSGGEEEEEYSHNESDSEDELEGDGSGLFDSNGEQKPSLKERLGLNHSSALENTRDASVSPSPDLEASDNVFTANNLINGQSKNSNSKLSQTHNHQQKRERELTDSTSSYGSLLEPEHERIRELDTESDSTNSLRVAATKTTTTTSSNRTKTPNSIVEEGCSDTDKISEDQGISTMDGSSDCSHRSRTYSEDEGTSRDVLDSELVPSTLDYKFQEACLNCDVDTLLKLVKHCQEIDIDRVNKMSGITALHHSVLEENFALVQHLVKDFKASIHVQDTDGWTPLHAASAVGNLQIAQFLLERGAKASILNNSCEFPVDVAEDKAMEKLLKNAMLGPSVGKLFSGVLTR